ncbi:MAG: hypothetical protein WBY44_00265 [Bryobacteraceae bacterium]
MSKAVIDQCGQVAIVKVRGNPGKPIKGFVAGQLWQALANTSRLAAAKNQAARIRRAHLK